MSKQFLMPSDITFAFLAGSSVELLNLKVDPPDKTIGVLVSSLEKEPGKYGVISRSDSYGFSGFLYARLDADQAITIFRSDQTTHIYVNATLLGKFYGKDSAEFWDLDGLLRKNGL